MSRHAGRGDLKKQAEYVAAYSVSLPSESVGAFTQNRAVDSVLRYYAEKAQVVYASAMLNP